MKNFTRLLLLAGAASLALGANADTQWVKSQETLFNRAQAGTSIMADFNNSGRLDIFAGGEASNDKWENLPGVWSWQTQANLYYNEGDGKWSYDGFVPVANGEPVQATDEEGNPSVDENGNPVMIQYYRLELPKHGILPVRYNNMVAFDYDQDGNVDIFLTGQFGNNDQLGCKNNYPNVNDQYVALYHNEGNGTFTMVDNTGIPMFKNDHGDGKAIYNRTIAVGDYDRDGYPDLFLTGLHLEEQPEGYPGRMAALFHNEGGTGKFVRKDIATVKNGVWTSEIKDDAENVIVEKKALEGWFLPQSNNCHFIDLNNDGWLDLVVDGWADAVPATGQGGNTAQVYLNINGEKFEDVTPESVDFADIPRSNGSVLGDFDADGYADFFVCGYSDKVGFCSRLFTNAYAYTQKNDEIYSDFIDQSMFKGIDNVDWYERHRTHLRDFDGDGCLDIFFDGCSDSFIFYGSASGDFTRAEKQLDARGYNGEDAVQALGDVTGNGLADEYQIGYLWEGDWKWAGFLWLNQGENEVVAPEAPAEVDATIADGKINITWKDNDDPTLAYNVFVTTPAGKTLSILPADVNTGFIKVGDEKHIAVRPGVQSYTLPAAEDGAYTVGVQALSLYNEKASAFTTKQVGTDGIFDAAIEALSEGPAYNVYGQPVSDDYKGVVIKAGKKYYNR